MPTSNVTQSNIELHAKTPVIRARNTIQNQQQSLKSKQKSRAFTLKKISALILALFTAEPISVSNNYITESHSTPNLPENTIMKR